MEVTTVAEAARQVEARVALAAEAAEKVAKEEAKVDTAAGWEAMPEELVVVAAVAVVMALVGEASEVVAVEKVVGDSEVMMGGVMVEVRTAPATTVGMAAVLRGVVETVLATTEAEVPAAAVQEVMVEEGWDTEWMAGVETPEGQLVAGPVRRAQGSLAVTQAVDNMAMAMELEAKARVGWVVTVTGHMETVEVVVKAAGETDKLGMLCNAGRSGT